MIMQLKIHIIKLLVLSFVLFLFSYALEAIFLNGKDLTVLMFIITLVLIMFNIICNKGIPKFNIVDMFLFLLISYTLLHSMFISKPTYGFKFIIASLVPYFIGRYIYLDIKQYKYFKRITNIVSWIVITSLIIAFIHSSNNYRVVIGNTHPVALGELMGIFVITNLFNIKGLNTTKFSLSNVIIGLLVMLLILGSRGAFFSTVIAIFVVYFLRSNSKLKVLISIIFLTILYFVFFSEESMLIEIFPSLYRFSPSVILNDPSVVGHYHYIGRKDLYILSLEVIKNSPFFGQGLGIVYSHNLFLEITSALGIVGVFLLVMWLVGIVSLIFMVGFNNVNNVLLALFLQSFIYKQTSFAFDAYKTLFIFGGMLVTYLSMKSTKYKKEGDSRG